jgi:hypothetical protein
MTEQATAPAIQEEADPHWTEDEVQEMEDETPETEPPAEPCAGAAQDSDTLFDWAPNGHLEITTAGLTGLVAAVAFRLSAAEMQRLQATLRADIGKASEALSSQLADELAATAAHAEYKAAAGRLAELQAEKRRFEEVIAQVGANLDAAPPPGELAELAAREADARARLAVVTRAAKAAKEQRDEAARALFMAEQPLRTRLAAQADQAEAERQAKEPDIEAGLARVASEALTQLVLLSLRRAKTEGEVRVLSAASATTGGAFAPARPAPAPPDKPGGDAPWQYLPNPGAAIPRYGPDPQAPRPNEGGRP